LFSLFHIIARIPNHLTENHSNIVHMQWGHDFISLTRYLIPIISPGHDAWIVYVFWAIQSHRNRPECCAFWWRKNMSSWFFQTYWSTLYKIPKQWMDWNMHLILTHVQWTANIISNIMATMIIPFRFDLMPLLWSWVEWALSCLGCLILPAYQ
jgi:hypothetical protein